MTRPVQKIDNYVNAPFTRQQKDKEKRRARDEALKEARDKARGDNNTCNLNSSLTTNEKSVRHILGTLSFHFLTHFFFCMYIVIMGYQRLFTPLNCTLILDIHC